MEVDIISLINDEKYDEVFDEICNILRAKNRKALGQWKMNLSRNPDLENLAMKAYDYEELYFDDMRLIKYKNEIGTCTDEETNESYTSSIDDIANFITIGNWIFNIVSNSDDFVGCTYNYKKTIEITEDYKNDESTILHEMIHAYELMLGDENLNQYIVIQLYKELSSKISDLDKYIQIDSHVLLKEHSLLFMLKALDLDLRLGLKLGSIYSYGREELYDNGVIND
jgi:hypothetical protein